MPKRSAGDPRCFRRASDGLWVGPSAIGRDPDSGRLVYRRVYATTRDACILKRDQAKQDAAEGRTPLAVDRARQTVTQLCRRYVATLEPPARSEHTHRAAAAVLANWITPAIGGLLVRGELGADHVRLLHRFCAKHPRTAQRAHTTLHAALKWARRQRPPEVAENVCELVDPPRYEPPERTPLGADQVRAFFAAARARRDRYLVFWLLAIYTGLRPSEIRGL